MSDQQSQSQPVEPWVAPWDSPKGRESYDNAPAAPTTADIEEWDAEIAKMQAEWARIECGES